MKKNWKSEYGDMVEKVNFNLSTVSRLSMKQGCECLKQLCESWKFAWRQPLIDEIIEEVKYVD